MIRVVVAITRVASASLEAASLGWVWVYFVKVWGKRRGGISSGPSSCTTWCFGWSGVAMLGIAVVDGL